jgi:hypothetical protein
MGDELEEQVRFPAVDGQISHFIDYHQGPCQIGLVVGLLINGVGPRKVSDIVGRTAKSSL